MPFSVEMYFDRSTEARIRKLWATIASAGVSSLMPDIDARPHISLAVYSTVDPVDLSRHIQQFAASGSPITTEFASVGLFPGEEGVVYIAPVVTAELLTLHRRFHESVQHLRLDCIDYYRTGRWVPHCTVAIDVLSEKQVEAATICHSSNVFRHVSIEAIGLVEFRPVRTECVYDLRTT